MSFDHHRNGLRTVLMCPLLCPGAGKVKRRRLLDISGSIRAAAAMAQTSGTQLVELGVSSTAICDDVPPEAMHVLPLGSRGTCAGVQLVRGLEPLRHLTAAEGERLLQGESGTTQSEEQERRDGTIVVGESLRIDHVSRLRQKLRTQCGGL
nr:hypothetical protein CFP56_16569 [Quercus suber]